MGHITDKFIKLKTAIGGNREKHAFEWTTGIPMEEKAKITRPTRANVRIISELEYLMHLSEDKDGAYDELLEAALDYLLASQKEQGVLTDQVCEKAEEMLMPLEAAAKEYEVILASHAHIDMNWMWSFQETVAITLATFRSILNIMDEYPEFTFSQSQASVYKIVEEYDPAMMEEIKERIAQGRWEVTANAWVETDKNMPSGESLLRHIEYTQDYLKNTWGVKRLDVDFSPDTFGHSANVPEINNYGGVKYYYHCRGKEIDQVLYRFKAPSGKEVLVHREHNWYNSGITPHIGTQVPVISKRSGGLKTGLIVYGVGDHGGGPTRRDVERALEMMTWKLFPRIRFGTMHEYFDEAIKVWDKLPVVDKEMNFIFQGCYTTQSRVKRGNKRTEAILNDAEHMSALAGSLVKFPYAKKQLRDAWINVLFTHFHDIITGSCMQDSREYAMGLYQTSTAVANTQIQNAMRNISLQIDTSSIPVDIDAYNSQSEGAGVGYGVENFIGVPSTERGSGRTRIFHVFNTLTGSRKETVELTVWDWTGDMDLIEMKDYQGREIPFQLMDTKTEEYWGHQFFRVLADVEVPALGYTTVVLSEKKRESYPLCLNEYPWERLGAPYEDFVLENENIRVSLNRKTGRIASIVEKASGNELISSGTGAGFTYMEAEPNNMSAWIIGRTMQDQPVENCKELKVLQNGKLRKSVKAVYGVKDSKIEVIYSLDKGATAVKMDVTIDWNEHSVGKETIPVLDYRVPAAYEVKEYMYDIPAGSICREEIHDDVPGLNYGLAVPETEASGAILISDCKYGYRGEDNAISLKLINSSCYPDPYPERGIHHITLWLGNCEADAKKAGELAENCNHALFYQPSNCHTGSLPMESCLLQAEAGHTLVSAVQPDQGGSILVRVYEIAGEAEEMKLTFANEIAKAYAVDLAGNVLEGKVRYADKQVLLAVEPYAIAAVKVVLA